MFLSPVELLQNEWEFNQLLQIYKTLSPKNIVEIGSFYGGTLWYWIKNNSNLKTITSIDLSVPPSDGRYEQMIKSKSQWSSWIPEGVTLYALEGDSHKWDMIQSVQWTHKDTGVDFLFIDGDHTYAGVKADYENYSKFVIPGGVIVFHDVIGLGEVAKFWNEVKKGKRYIEICENNSVGWGIGVLYV